jgi:hypothetical protein
MARVSPTIEGFRAAFRRPSLTFAEISWRWTIGATFWALAFYAFFEFLNTLPVSGVDAALLATRQPPLVAKALEHIFRGSMDRAVLAVLYAVVALSLFWTILAAVGRTATVRALLDYFRDRNAGGGDAASELPTESKRGTFASLVGLNFLRVALVLAAILAFLGAAILAGFASSKGNPQPSLAFVLFLPLAALIFMVWSWLGWLLALSGVFAVRDNENTPGAISAAIDFCRSRTGAVFAVSAWTGVAHFVAFSIATTAASLPLALLQFVSWRFVIVAVILVALVYFAFVDWLYMARLAGYVCILEMPEELVSPPVPAPPAPPFAESAPLRQTIDQSELILSDLPIPASG